MSVRWFIFAGVLLAAGIPRVVAQDNAPNMRPYSEGPLRGEDFQGKAPDEPQFKNNVKLLAYSLTDIYYNYKYQFEKRGNTVTAWAAEVTFTAMFLRDKSWNRAPQNIVLLAHEQGHFDITQIYTWRCQQAFDKLMAKKAIIGRGATEDEARKAMEAEINKQREPFLQAWRDEHLRYDKETNHAQDRARQRGWRAKLDEQLALVARERAAAKPANPPRKQR